MMGKSVAERTKENRKKEPIEEPGHKTRTDRRKPAIEETQGEDKKIQKAAMAEVLPLLRKIARRLKKIEKDLTEINEQKLARPDLELLREEILKEIRPLTKEERWRRVEGPIVKGWMLFFDSLINEYKALKAGVVKSAGDEIAAKNSKKMVYKTFFRLVRGLSEVLADLKVKPFLAKGKFNPKRHYAVKSREARKPEQHHMVVKCLRAGFTAEIGGRLHLVRPALVEVYRFSGASGKKEEKDGKEERHNACRS